MNNTTPNEAFDQLRRFDDCRADDGEPGPAQVVMTSGRCADCWGRIVGSKDAAGLWRRIQCLVCGRAVDGNDAAREVEAMQQEAEENMNAVCVGRPAKYRSDGRFVLKLVPEMARDRTKIDQRIAKSLAEGRQHGRLTRHEFPAGTAGYLYAQAKALLAGVENLSDKRSAIHPCGLRIRRSQGGWRQAESCDGTVKVTSSVPLVHRKPSSHDLMERMGTALISGMAQAFACAYL